MDDVWGRVIEHDGRAESVPLGMYVRVQSANGAVCEGWLTDRRSVEPPPEWRSRWVWATLLPRDWHLRFVRYQVRRPRGMEVLDRCLAQLGPDPDDDGPAPRTPVPVLPEEVDP